MNKPCLKRDLIDRVGRRSGVPPKISADVVDTIIEHMRVALKSGQHIEIRSFGSFHLRKYRPRLARNPKTGEAVHVEQPTRVHFKSGRELRNNMMGGLE